MIDILQIFQNNHPGNVQPTDLFWFLRAPYTPGNDCGITAADLFSSISQLGTYGIDSGTANAFIVSIPAPLATYVDGYAFSFKALNSNTGASTINFNGLGARAIYINPNNPLNGGEIFADGTYVVQYNSTVDGFILINSSVSGETPVVTVTASTYQLAANTRYYINRPSLVMLAMPANGRKGDQIKIVNMSHSFQISQPAGMNIRLLSQITSTGEAGSILSSNVGDNLLLECLTAPDLWFGQSIMGNLDVV